MVRSWRNVMRFRFLVLAGAVAIVLGALAGCGGQAGSTRQPAPGGGAEQAGGPGVTITDAWVRAAAEGDMSAAYFTVTNQGQSAVRLTGVRTGVAGEAEVHESMQEGNTVRMQPVAAVEIPAGGRVTFAPGGYHVMLMDLKQTLHPGDRVDLTLVFEGGLEVPVTAEVRDMAGTSTGGGGGEHSEGH